MRNAMVFMALALLLGACAAPATPPPPPTSAATSAPSATAEATLTSTLTSTTTSTTTPEPTLAFTPTLSLTPEVVQSSTPAFVFHLPTQTPTSTTALDCSLLMQSVANGTNFKPGERFSIGWKVQNSGTATWFPGTVVFQFIGGSKLYLSPLIQLKNTVQPGQVAILNVDMRAPMNSTKYTTLWSLRQGNAYFCRVKLTIYVQ